jgi:mannose-6-phosphate isomerase-like protein (cupin superfamily)
MYQSINIAQKFTLFTEQWQPKVVAEMNDYQFKVVRILGDFIWHSHPETDETLIVLEGVLRLDFRDKHLLLQAGEMIVVPRGVEHKPRRKRKPNLC